ncbi:MAG: mycothiol synthase [Acidimicrobiia bacterium]|nr:mycothiol synthase [Acidimicrobiia bacterium]
MEPGDARLDIRVVDTLDGLVSAHARELLARALPPEEQDDRFDEWPRADGDGDDVSDAGSAGPSHLAALATAGSDPVGYLGGAPSDGVVQLDALVDPLTPSEAGGADRVLAAMFDAVVEQLGAAGIERVELWAKPVRSWHRSLAESRDMTEFRALHQMRCPLPVDAEPIPTRAFTDDDLDELVLVNNRAFASHPDQGGQTVETLTSTMSEPWFRADGLRIFERDGRIAGFCWTKIHRSPPAATELGEIYVIGVDPDFHGQGLGVPMTAAGLDWLADQGIETGMLYVEADNVPAVRTYERLGFVVLRTDLAWIWAPPAADSR